MRYHQQRAAWSWHLAPQLACSKSYPSALWHNCPSRSKLHLSQGGRTLPRKPEQAPTHTMYQKSGVSKVSRLGWDRRGGHSTAPGENARKQSRSGQHENANLKNTWDTWGDNMLYLECFPESTGHRNPSMGTKEMAGTISLPAPQHKHRAACEKQHKLDAGCLSCSRQVPHRCALPVPPF